LYPTERVEATLRGYAYKQKSIIAHRALLIDQR
jgi:hypothetical protein